ncbi:hypothetical protein BKA81DRAFT_13751 [Phyllosticta paracitricarpa]
MSRDRDWVPVQRREGDNRSTKSSAKGTAGYVLARHWQRPACTQHEGLKKQFPKSQQSCPLTQDDSCLILSDPLYCCPHLESNCFSSPWRLKHDLIKSIHRLLLIHLKDHFHDQTALISRPSVIVACAMSAPGPALCADVSQPRQVGRKVRIPPRG